MVGYQILLPPVVGLANSGDFGKVIGVFGLTAPIEDENAWAATRYEFNPEKRYWAGFYSSEHLVMPGRPKVPPELAARVQDRKSVV